MTLNTFSRVCGKFISQTNQTRNVYLSQTPKPLLQTFKLHSHKSPPKLQYQLVASNWVTPVFSTEQKCDDWEQNFKTCFMAAYVLFFCIRTYPTGVWRSILSHFLVILLLIFYVLFINYYFFLWPPTLHSHFPQHMPQCYWLLLSTVNYDRHQPDRLINIAPTWNWC